MYAHAAHPPGQLLEQQLQASIAAPREEKKSAASSALSWFRRKAAPASDTPSAGPASESAESPPRDSKEGAGTATGRVASAPFTSTTSAAATTIKDKPTAARTASPAPLAAAAAVVASGSGTSSTSPDSAPAWVAAGLADPLGATVASVDKTQPPAAGSAAPSS
jgi:hypothetical protein